METKKDTLPKIALVGFGEAASAFLTGWELAGSGRVTAFDIKLARPDTAAEMTARIAEAEIAAARDPAGALSGAVIAFSLVTADQALVAAETAAPHLAPGTYWHDCNSCAPETKRAAAALIEAAGGQYVDVAVMAPVHPGLHRTPVLLAGPSADNAAALMEGLGMRPRIAGPGVGDASSIKMLRSVMIKGLEALTAECFLAARKAGVDEAVLASLLGSDPGIDWPVRAAYNLDRMMVHGARRAAEMREVAATLRALGLPDRMAAATSEWQDGIAALALAPGEARLADRADRILEALGGPKAG